MTELLFHTESYLKEFEATVTDVVDGGVVLNRTAFYAGGGGQPADSGTLILWQPRIQGNGYQAS